MSRPTEDFGPAEDKNVGTKDMDLRVQGLDDRPAVDEDHDAVRMIEVPSGKWLRRYRSVAFQMVILAGLSFSGPSMGNAISALGGRGQGSPYTANIGASAQYAMSALFTMFGGPIISAVGIPVACIFGAMGFPLNGSGFYVLSKYKIQWYFILAKAIYGFTSSALYVSEASAMISYPEAHRRGFYLSTWLSARNLGSVISGSISLSLNLRQSGVGGVTTNTYLIFLGIECIGVPLSLLLTSTRKVVRSDGYGVPLLPKKSWRREMRLLWDHHKQRRALIMIPLFFFTFFGDGVWFTYLGESSLRKGPIRLTMLALHFSVRTRAFSALVAPLTTMAFNYAFALLVLDNTRMGPKRRAQVGVIIYMGLSFIMVGWGMGMVKYFIGKPSKLRLDFINDTGLFFMAYLPFWLYYCFSYAGANLIYWTMGQFASDVTTNARAGGVFRSWETIGQAVAYGIDSRVKSPWVSMSIVLVLTTIAAPCFWTVIQDIPVHEKALHVVEDPLAQTEQKAA